MAEIGSLVVNLQANTAQFNEQLEKAKSNLGGLKGAAADSSTGVRSGMDGMGHGAGGVRTQIGLLDNAIRGAHAQAMADLIRKFSDTEIVMKLLPIAAMGAAFVVMGGLAVEGVEKIVEAYQKAKQAAKTLADAQTNATTTAQMSLTALGDKLIEAGIKADNLANDHIGALKGQLELLDHASLKELIDEFDILSGAADKAIDAISGGTHFWEVWKSSATGAKDALADFKTQYASLVAQGNDAGAKSLLDGTLQSALKLQDAQKTYNSIMKEGDDGSTRSAQDQATLMQAANQLDAAGIQADAAGLAIQQQVVATLQDQVRATATINATKAQSGANDQKDDAIKDAAKAKELATAAAHKLAEADRQEAAYEKIAALGVEQHSAALIKLARTRAETALASTKGGEPSQGGEDSSINDRLQQQKAAIEAEKDDSIQAATVALDAKKVAYEADVREASLTAEQKKALTQEWKNSQQSAADAIVQINADANEKIVSAERTAANARAAAEKAYNQEVAKDALSVAELKASLTMKAAEQDAKNQQALHNATAATALKSAQAAVQAETNAEVAGYNARLKALDKFDKDYLKSVQELQTDITKAEMKGQAEQQSLAATAAQKEAMTIKQAQDKMADAIGSDIAKSIVMNKSLAAAFRQTGEQMAEQMIKNMIVAELTGNRTKLISAEGAATKSYDWAAGWGGPIAGGIAAAAAFAGVMSFEVGGKIPGEGPVPITGHGGETVVTKALTDRVETAERNGGGNNGSSGGTHIHYAPQIHAVDSTGVDDMLAKHASVFQRHVTAAMRRRNK